MGPEHDTLRLIKERKKLLGNAKVIGYDHIVGVSECHQREAKLKRGVAVKIGSTGRSFRGEFAV